MNSQFRNSRLGFYLYAIIIFIIAAASIFVFWYMVKGYKLGTYPEDTILGSVYIGGISEDEVEGRMIQKVDRWLSDDTIVFELTYQGYSYEFDRELFYFDYDTSIFYIDGGQTNELVVTYQGNLQQEVVNEIKSTDFLIGNPNLDNFDIDQLIRDVLSDASLMKTFSNKHLEDYIIDENIAYTEIGSINLIVPDGVSVDTLISNVSSLYPNSKIMVNSKELYDVVDELGADFTDSEMTILSQGMLALVLGTNFAINEVHYLPIIDYINYDINTFPLFGHNAVVNQVIGDSFSFYNPNNSPYYFTLTKIDDTNVKLTLIGLDFIDDIVVDIHKTPIDYITQTTNNPGILQTGYDGMIIEVNRKILDIHGYVIYNKVILFEFYPPIKEIILEP